MENNSYLTQPFAETTTTSTTKSTPEPRAEHGTQLIKTSLSDIPLKTVFMRNLGKDVTKDELVDLFGRHKTPFLKAHTRIGIVHGWEHNTAIK